MEVHELVAAKLQGRLLKYTATIHWTDGTTTEFQTDDTLRTEYDGILREPVLVTGYNSLTLIKWSAVRSVATGI